uniref:Uncharacterized protein n=1 Tax=Mandrillus leucophaeus TaxID=9568 RepID=A0A2K5XSK9_MANLE
MADSFPWPWEAWLLGSDCEVCADSVFTSKIMHAHTTPKHNLTCSLCQPCKRTMPEGGCVLPTQWGADRSHSAKAC